MLTQRQRPLRRLVPAALLVGVALALPVAGETLILQEGKDGYKGCTDTYVRADGYSTGNGLNYGNEKNLHVRNEHYNGG